LTTGLQNLFDFSLDLANFLISGTMERYASPLIRRSFYALVHPTADSGSPYMLYENDLSDMPSIALNESKVL
jgi:hypothetical protein